MATGSCPPRGDWNQWSFDITWSTATTPGSITAQLDGTQVGAHQGPNSYSQTTNAPHRDTVPYHKIGLYRPNWKAEKGHVNGGTPPVVIYYDNISITPITAASGNPTAAPSSAAPAPAASPKPVTAAPSTRPSASGPAPESQATQTSAPAAATGPAAPGSTSGPANDIPADTDTDNNDLPLAETGPSGRTPLVLAAGSALLVAGLLLIHRIRARSATRPTRRRVRR
ncbi:heparin lyase I family protein [Kitasatospora herbaricolor]|uniref:Polysaccharide lyase n=1 Tax=Kitasatospora herbaricolor TaxID=68217 RepID=A0ABZ1WHL2_9ACTN|nr:heparin lyase I family protein [Kitasatospora herbaricolor]